MARPQPIQTVTNTATAATSTTLTINTTKGNLLFVAFTSTAAISPTISDTASNTYTAQATNTTNSVLYSWYTYNIAGGNITITISHSSGVTAALVREYSNILKITAINPADKSAIASSATGTAAASGATSAIAEAQELVIGYVSHTIAANGLTIGTGFNNLSTVSNTNILGVEDLIRDDLATQNGTMTIGGTGGPWAAAVITFKSTHPSTVKSGLRPHPFSPGIAR
jgi:hypothetical protein